jgi:hypothetical protein
MQLNGLPVRGGVLSNHKTSLSSTSRFTNCLVGMLLLTYANTPPLLDINLSF